MLDRVTDTKKDSTTAAAKEAEAKLSRAQEAFQKAFATFVDAAMDYGWEHGWSVGYDSGWEAAFEHLRKQELALRAIAKAEKPRAPSIPQPTLPFLQVGAGRSTRVADLVLDYIKDHPGQRGVDIAKYFADWSPSIPERTVRTALHRLRHHDQKIENVDGAWHAVKEK